MREIIIKFLHDAYTEEFLTSEYNLCIYGITITVARVNSETNLITARKESTQSQCTIKYNDTPQSIMYAMEWIVAAFI